MPYTFLTAGAGVVTKPPKETFNEYFQKFLEQQFKETFDWHTIREEFPYGSMQWKDIDVRITHVINSETGVKLGDDYKAILFRELSHATGVGCYYYFDDNYWIVINSENIKNLAASCTVKRCNNLLRWMDTNGKIRTVPCSINYIISENRDYSTAGSALVVPSGMLEITTQFNQESNFIVPNTRFLFGNPGNWVAYKVLGGGINNYNRMKTEDPYSTGLLILSMGTNYVNDATDDLELGVADMRHSEYSMELSKLVAEGNVGGSSKISAVIKLNGEVVGRDVVWSVDDENIAWVDGDGTVFFTGIGGANLTCQMSGNEYVRQTIPISVVKTPVKKYRISISPLRNYLLEGDTATFEVLLYANDVLQSNVFAFVLDANGVPSGNYVFSIEDGNVSIRTPENNLF
jgi:hypothetical protein